MNVIIVKINHPPFCFSLGPPLEPLNPTLRTTEALSCHVTHLPGILTTSSSSSSSLSRNIRAAPLAARFLRAQTSSLKCFDSCVTLRLKLSQPATRLSQLKSQRNQKPAFIQQHNLSTMKWEIKGPPLRQSVPPSPGYAKQWIFSNGSIQSYFLIYLWGNILILYRCDILNISS